MSAAEKVVVYTTVSCPYCRNAKDLLSRRGIPFEEKLVPYEDEAQWDALYERSKMRTMPQIFAGQRLIGGYQELSELDGRDQLASLKTSG